PPGETAIMRQTAPLSGWHGEAFDFLQNSIFNARKFFQAGPVQPSRQNRYGAKFSIAAPPLGDISAEFSGRKSRGRVNGKLIVAVATELKTPPASIAGLRASIRLKSK